MTDGCLKVPGDRQAPLQEGGKSQQSLIILPVLSCGPPSAFDFGGVGGSVTSGKGFGGSSALKNGARGDAQPRLIIAGNLVVV